MRQGHVKQQGEEIKSQSDKWRGYKSRYDKNTNNSGSKHNRDEQATEEANALTEASKDATTEGIECFICHQRDSHDSTDCPNGDAKIYMKNMEFKKFKVQNAKDDSLEPKKRWRVV